jgi:hypothetical protein
MRKLTIIAFLLTVFAVANAQKKENYWVVETDGKTARHSIVKIYDGANNLVNERKIDRLIDINRKKERRRLNRMLRQQDSQLLWSKR